jgi:hypothetical protein
MNPHRPYFAALAAFQADSDRAIAAMVAERQRALKSVEVDLMVAVYCSEREDAKLRDFVERIRNLNEPGRTEFMWSLLALAMHAPKGVEMIERRLLAAELLNVKISRKGAK